MSEKVYNVFEEERAAWVTETVNDMLRRKMEYMRKDFVEIIKKHDFITGSMETKDKILEILPGANVVYSLYVKDPTMVYVIKKFDIKDLLKEPYPTYESEVEEIMTALDQELSEDCISKQNRR